MSLIIRYNVYYFDVYGNIKSTPLKKESVNLSEALSCIYEIIQGHSPQFYCNSSNHQHTHWTDAQRF
jgi:hypothetical protein